MAKNREDQMTEDGSTTDRPCNEVLIEKLSAAIDYMRQEWSMTYTEVIGCLEVVKNEMFREIKDE